MKVQRWDIYDGKVVRKDDGAWVEWSNVEEALAFAEKSRMEKDLLRSEFAYYLCDDDMNARLFLIANDVFGHASSHTYEVKDEELAEIHGVYMDEGVEALVRWMGKKIDAEPMDEAMAQIRSAEAK